MTINVFEFVGPETIKDTYDELYMRTSLYAGLALNLEEMQADLEAKIAKATVAEQIVGKNTDLRKAAARELFFIEHEAVDEVTHDTKVAKLNLDLASIRKSHVLSLLRLTEVLVRAESNENN